MCKSWKELEKWGNKKIKKLKCWDVTLIKVSMLAFALLVAKLWSPILSLEWHWYLVIFLAAAAKPAYTVFFK